MRIVAVAVAVLAYLLAGGGRSLEAAALLAILGITALLLATLASELAQASSGLESTAAANRRLAEAQAVAQMGSWQWEPETESLTWSDQLYCIHGVARAAFEPTFERFLGMVHRDDRPYVKLAIATALESRRSFAFDHRIVRPDGTTRELHCRGEIEAGEGDGPVVLRGTAQDITDRKRAERELRELLDAAPDAMVIVDSSETIVLVNAQAETTFGYARHEMLGQPVEMLLTGPFGKWHEREPYGVHKDGGEFPVEVSLRPLEIDGRVLVSSAIRDISERKSAQYALTQAEERFRTAFEDAPVGIALLALNGRITQVNRALATIVRRSPGQLVGQHVTALTHLSDADIESEQLWQLAAGEIDGYQIEKRLVPAEGEPVWVAVSTSLVRDGSGAPRHLIAHFQDITVRRRFESQLQFLADHDPLTQLFNRRRFEEELDRLLDHVHRYRQGAAMLMIDLDNFKDINDTLGHGAGDELIQNVGRAIRGRLRKTDVLARLGGDEFAVLLHRVGREEAAAVASSLLEAIRNLAIPGALRSARPTASIGVTILEAGCHVTAETVLVEADLAMYEAKAAGRDGLSLYAPGGTHEEDMRARLAWGERLRGAIANDDFELDSQPILDLGTGRVTHHELLIRLRLESGERVAPADFLLRAERFGLIRDIDRWVLREAIALLSESPDARFAVNLSAQSVTDPALPGFLRDELANAGTDPGRLILEVTETDAIAQMDEARRLVSEVAALGCSLALDDFGAGFGSFYYLKHLPFDLLKIDGEFIRMLTTSQTDQLIVRSLVDTARGLGMKTVAEYVGDDETLAMVRELGVDLAQGFHVGRPAPIPPSGRAGGSGLNAARRRLKAV